jgi:F-type H+-transporting ATPase subunit gamma
MSSTRDIKRRQKSVSNTKQVTKAMEMVAASKMRKSQTVALKSRPYAQHALSILSQIKQRQSEIKNIFLTQRTSKKILLIIVTSDKGLCGGLNSAVIKESSKVIQKYQDDGFQVTFVLVGVASTSFFQRTGLNISQVFKGAGDYIDIQQIKPISDFIQKQYETSDISKVMVIYTEFISTLKQKVSKKQILPIPQENEFDIENSEPAIMQKGGEYIFEPNVESILNTLIPFLLDIYIYHIILESNASEHSARMVAMKNASENADSILKNLTLSYNKARQASITGAIAEITAGVEALK